MKKSEKAVLGMVLLGLGAGASKLTYDHRDGIKSRLNSHKHKKSRSRLIHNTYRMIMPRLTGFGVQVDAHHYLDVLKYVSRRYEFHVEHASKRLGVPHNRMYNMTIALTRQNVLSHTLSNQYFVRQPVARHIISAIEPYFHRYGSVNVNGYRREIKLLVKDEIQ